MSPLVASGPVKFAFGLHGLKIHDGFPQFDRDWSATFRVLTASKTPRTLRQLDLEDLPQACTHMLSMTPFAAGLHRLFLPPLRMREAHMWRLWAFARLCETLELLSLYTYEGDTIAVLQAFPTGPECLHINELVATVGYENPDVDEAVITVPDSVQSLVSSLWTKAHGGTPRVKRLTVTSHRLLTPKRLHSLFSLCHTSGLSSIHLGREVGGITLEEVHVQAQIQWKLVAEL